MSGGHYDYAFNMLENLADEIEQDYKNRYIFKNCNTTEEEVWIAEEALQLITDLRNCAKRAYELEWYMSSDTDIESYKKRVSEIE